MYQIEYAAIDPMNDEFLAQERRTDDIRIARAEKRRAIYKALGPNELRRAVLQKWCETGLKITEREALELVLSPIPERLWPGLFNK